MIEHHSVMPQAEREAFGHWLSGFTDGEGCFYLRLTHEGRGYVRFEIRLRRDDAPILEDIHRYLGVGHLCNTADGGFFQAAFRVHKLSDFVDVLVPHFDRFPLRAKKARDYAIWREAVILWQGIASRPRSKTEKRWTEADAAEFSRLTLALRAGRTYEPSIRRAAEIKADRLRV